MPVGGAYASSAGFLRLSPQIRNLRKIANRRFLLASRLLLSLLSLFIAIVRRIMATPTSGSRISIFRLGLRYSTISNPFAESG